MRSNPSPVERIALSTEEQDVADIPEQIADVVGDAGSRSLAGGAPVSEARPT